MVEFFETPKIFESSPKMKQTKQIDRRWETIEIGQSFSIPLNEANLAQLRNKCWVMGKKLGKRFRALQYENCYEIGRIEKKD